ncbi:MAG: minC [Herminiimonas sp.]|nr:minC [Herminiimonas sp.]
MSKNQFRKPIEIKISTVVAVAAILHDADLGVLNAAMQEMTGGEPDYFDDEFAVIDVGFINTASQPIDWAALIALFKSYRLNPVAVRHAGTGMEPAILAHGLSLDVVARPREAAPHPEAAAAPAPAAPPAQPVQPVQPAVVQLAPVGSMIIDTPVRAGQRIYAQGCDLIVTAVVNNGAELIADGSIHIYAPLRGRALAGARGNGAARIFTMGMEAELVSIAGIYRTFEDGLPPALSSAPAQVRLSGDRIEVLSLSAGAHR